MQVVTRKVSAVRDPKTRRAQLALREDLAGRNHAPGTSPVAYRASVRALFASHLGEPPPSAPPIVDDPLTGVPIAFVPALDANGDHVLAPESALTGLDARGGHAGKSINPLLSLVK